MNSKKHRTLFLFVDESGNFDFSQKGTKFFILSCLTTFNPILKRERFLALRYALIYRGYNQEFFHATEDRQFIRNTVFRSINELGDNFEIHSVVAQKNKVDPSLYLTSYYKKGRLIQRITGDKFYQKLCHVLLQYVFAGLYLQPTEKVVVILSSLFTRDKRSLILRMLKTDLKNRFFTPSEIYFHQAKADINCQIADYCGWAIAVKWERNEGRSYNVIRNKIKSEFEIFKYGTKIYY